MAQQNKKTLLFASLTLIALILIVGGVLTAFNWNQLSSVINQTSSYSVSSSQRPSQRQGTVYDRSYKINFLPKFEIKYNDQWTLDASKAPTDSEDLKANSYQNQIILANQGVEIVVGFLNSFADDGVANCVRSNFPFRTFGNMTRVARAEKIGADGNVDFFAGSYFYTAKFNLVSKNTPAFRAFKENSLKKYGEKFGSKSLEEFKAKLDSPNLNVCYSTPTFPYYSTTESQTGKETVYIELKNITNLSTEQIRIAEELIAQIRI